MKCITVDAVVENLEQMIDFINDVIADVSCSERIRREVDIAASEWFTNICYYAYDPNVGQATICAEVEREPLWLMLTFTDAGIPFDPLQKETPDFFLPEEEQDGGGIGIFIVKKRMDDLSYEYKDGKNILRMRKNLTEE